jgi:5-(carboxyamino)imidazole ribonucleotide synthase
MISELYPIFVEKYESMAKSARLINTDFKVGILGGGQLGKMLAQAASSWDLPIYALERDQTFPAAPVVRELHEGNFKDYDDVLAFGRQMDVLTIEIEHVNTDALLELENEGVVIHPRPQALITIKDKGLQKQFYAERDIPTSDFQLWESKEALLAAIIHGTISYPFVQKSRTAGYDGKGVAVIKTADDREKILDGPCLTEDLVDIDKELAVVVARNPSGEIKAFPTVEMAFNPDANLVEFLLCPAQVKPEISRQAEELALQVIEAFDVCGLLAVELFLTTGGEILVNEVAPRPHNSGHHTIDSSYTSQFEQHLRGILDLPLGSTRLKEPVGVMVNLLGAPGHTGTASYEGLSDCLAMEGVYLHLYGKTQTRPFRKMGHATVIGDDVDATTERAREVMELLRIVAR